MDRTVSFELLGQHEKNGAVPDGLKLKPTRQGVSSRTRPPVVPRGPLSLGQGRRCVLKNSQSRLAMVAG